MTKRLLGISLMSMMMGVAPSTVAADKPETPHLVFVAEYIRELVAIENIRYSGEQELKQDPNDPSSSLIHISTLFI
jgi:hypothetical protein